MGISNYLLKIPLLNAGLNFPEKLKPDDAISSRYVALATSSCFLSFCSSLHTSGKRMHVSGICLGAVLARTWLGEQGRNCDPEILDFSPDIPCEKHVRILCKLDQET
ncbi:hypothetical protein I308_102407 [Cryptococcus tetragattii IND107]|uniref:Uncharacterized protein n=1 Tax=Cryptococcus tetragattii IND107 TaxID=1296105 RepID=A0ABR3BTF4_9TREE